MAVLFLVSCLAAAGQAHAFGFSAAPSRVQMNFDDSGETGYVEITNTSGSDLELRVRLRDFDMSEDNKPVLSAPGRSSFANWLVFQPREFSLPSGETRTVRFAVRPMEKPEDGEYRVMMTLREAGERNRESPVSFGVQMGIPIYATYGDIRRDGEILQVRGGRGELDLGVTSTGNAHLRFSGNWAVFSRGSWPGKAAASRILDSDGWSEMIESLGARAEGRLPGKPVMPGDTRTLKIRNDGIPGTGVVFFAGTLGNTPIKRSFTF